MSVLPPTHCTPGIINKGVSCCVLFSCVSSFPPWIPFCIRLGLPQPSSWHCHHQFYVSRAWGYSGQDLGAVGRRTRPDALRCPQCLCSRQSSCPVISPQHIEFRKQQDLDNILTWQPPEVSPMQHSQDKQISLRPSPHIQPSDGAGTWPGRLV